MVPILDKCLAPWLGHEKQCDCPLSPGRDICDAGLFLPYVIDVGIDRRDLDAVREALAEAIENGMLVYGDAEHTMGGGLRLLEAVGRLDVLQFTNRLQSE